MTALKVGPCVVVQRKTLAKDGYEAVQLGLVEFVKPNRVKRPMAGHFKKADVEPARFLRELRVDSRAESDLKPGDRVTVTGKPAVDGSKSMELIKVVAPSGKVLE